MQAGAALDVSTADQIFQSVCARNGPVELHYIGPGRRIRTARARVLDLDCKHIYVDTPQSIGRPVILPAGKPLSAYLQLSGEWYGFETRVVKPGIRVRLNKKTFVPGISLRRPEQLAKRQRRALYRISMAAYEKVFVLCHEVSADRVSAPVDAARFTGHIANLSGGGMGLVVEKHAAPDAQVGKEYFLTFELPEDPAPFILLVEIRCIRGIRIRKDEAKKLGIKFLQEPRTTRREDIERLHRFVFDTQRRELRRHR